MTERELYEAAAREWCAVVDFQERFKWVPIACAVVAILCAIISTVAALWPQ